MEEATTHIPAPSSTAKGKSKYKFVNLEPGQSVLESKPADMKPGLFASRVRASLAFHKNTKGGEYITRVEGDSVRIWRTK